MTAAGAPGQIRKKLASINELIEERSRRDWLIPARRAVADWATMGADGWLAIAGALIEP